MSKLTVQMSDEMDQLLMELSDERGLPKTQVLRDAVRLMKYLDDAAGNDQDIVLRHRGTGAERQILLERHLRSA